MRLDQKYHSLFERYHLNSPLRIANFLGQVQHESGGFKYLKELGKDSYFEKYECVLLACYQKGKNKLTIKLTYKEIKTNTNGGTITSFESN